MCETHLVCAFVIACAVAYLVVRGNLITAVSLATGAVQWQTPFAGSIGSNPALDEDRGTTSLIRSFLLLLINNLLLLIRFVFTLAFPAGILYAFQSDVPYLNLLAFDTGMHFRVFVFACSFERVLTVCLIAARSHDLLWQQRINKCVFLCFVFEILTFDAIVVHNLLNGAPSATLCCYFIVRP